MQGWESPALWDLGPHGWVAGGGHREPACYKAGMDEIDELDPLTRTGWSVMIQGAANHVDDEQERAAVARAGIEPWAGGERDQYLRIKPTAISGRRIRRG